MLSKTKVDESAPVENGEEADDVADNEAKLEDISPVG